MPDSNWNEFSRVSASQRWRQQSAAMGRHLTEAIVQEAQVVTGMRVLDIASGTGEPAISIAALLKGTGKVMATDLSPEPLKVGQQRALQRGLTNIEFTPSDVHNLAFPDHSFDRVTCRLGVMFFSDISKALREVYRVLKPNGRASFLAWGTRQQPYFETTIGTIQRILSRTDLPASGEVMFKFGHPGTLSAALREAGFGIVEERQEHLPWNWPGTPEELWAYFQEVTVPFKPLFQAIPSDKCPAVHEQVLAALRHYYNGNEVRLQASVILASATRTR